MTNIAKAALANSKLHSGETSIFKHLIVYDLMSSSYSKDITKAL